VYAVSRLLRALTLVCALPSCGGPASELEHEHEHEHGTLAAAVRGGQAAAVCEWPAVVGLDLGCSASLVHPEVVVYAAHCGEGIRSVSFGENLDRPERVVRTRRCVGHPEAALGNGFDVAFCVLDEPVLDVPVIPIAAGCELEAVREGMVATLVGFGLEDDAGAFGVKRSSPVVIEALGPDLVVPANHSGSCSGDSGGPLVIDVQRSPGDLRTVPRLLGALSASDAEECVAGNDHYSFLPALLPWLESASSRDLTPCFDADGHWDPVPGCTEAALPAESVAWNTACNDPAGQSEPRVSCGAAFAAELLLETTPPELELLAPALLPPFVADATGSFDTWLEAAASDAESGIADVRFELRNERGHLRAEQRDEVPPYRLEHLSLPPGTWQVLVTARDLAGNEQRADRTYSVTTTRPVREPSCSLAARPATASDGPWPLCLFLMMGYARRRTARRASLPQSRQPGAWQVGRCRTGT
jgi:hypothetical protein